MPRLPHEDEGLPGALTDVPHNNVSDIRPGTSMMSLCALCSERGFGLIDKNGGVEIHQKINK